MKRYAKGMRRLFRMAGVLLLSGVLLGSTGYAAQPLQTEPAEKTGIAAAGTIALDARADEIIAGMSLEEKVGQMMMLGIRSTELDEDTQSLLGHIPAAGIILYDANMQSKEQVKELNAALQQGYGQKWPLFIGLDEEGGQVARMKEELPAPLSQEAIGAAGNPQEARDSAVKISKELKALGFNMNFAPVADVGSGRERSFSKSAAAAADFVDAAVQGYEQEKMIYVLKHFPGLGKGQKDTHLDMVTVAASRAELQAEDLLPFRRIIRKNPEGGYFIMVSHISYPALDPVYPASLSHAIQTDLLRGELGYQGVIVTDAMEMGALSRHYSFDEMGVKAVQAGVDILLVCHGCDHERAIYDSVLAAVRDGTIPEARIDASVRRIIKIKLQRLIS